MLFRVTHNNLLQPVADSSHYLSSILHPTFSHFSCFDSILPTEHLSPLWIKRAGQAAGLCTIAHSLVPTQRGSCIKRNKASFSSFLPCWLSIHSQHCFFFSLPNAEDAFPSQIFSLCNSSGWLILGVQIPDVMLQSSRQRHCIKLSTWFHLTNEKKYKLHT